MAYGSSIEGLVWNSCFVYIDDVLGVFKELRRSLEAFERDISAVARCESETESQEMSIFA